MLGPWCCWHENLCVKPPSPPAPPPPLSRTNFHAFSASLVPFLIFLISMAGTVRFSHCSQPQSTPDNSNFQGNREKLINFNSEWNYATSRKLKPLLPNSPTSPSTLCKLVSRKWIRIRFFFSSPLNIPNFSLFCAFFQ